VETEKNTGGKERISSKKSMDAPQKITGCTRKVFNILLKTKAVRWNLLQKTAKNRRSSTFSTGFSTGVGGKSEVGKNYKKYIRLALDKQKTACFSSKRTTLKKDAADLPYKKIRQRFLAKIFQMTGNAAPFLLY
jgi:hypothetical protein